ncbi:MAG: kynureninase, partial [Flavobacteriaceae bacterium]
MENSLAFAQMMDKKFALDTLQEAYVFPQHHQKKAIYFLGNSLGLPAHKAHKAVEKINTQWAAHGVEGFFEAQPPWWDLEQQAAQELLPWVAAHDTEVAVLNSLTVNLHFLLLHFYKPSQKRFKIIVEEKAFPSDQYLIKSQLEFQGISPEDALIEIPRRGTCW